MNDLEILHVVQRTQTLQVGEQGVRVVNGEIVEQWGEGPLEFYDSGNGFYRARLKDGAGPDELTSS